MSKRVITINRMLGSNGRLIGKALAEELGFAFYDKELIDIAAQKENIPFDLLAKVDEKRGSPLTMNFRWTAIFTLFP